MDAVDGDMDVPVMGVTVKRIDRLVLSEAHLREAIAESGSDMAR